ncbi:monocarboxylate transporter [Aulographum hederae CBS 113979]|uniref:Monocarboxylate transporter n=1 Tax=Aulographum hederae CBS 113979 TaxID=1176131 RepID=A0A6G1GXW6_9PEZI|nr:monocarboxylate transporter [Aulographum hederae CBS 113979]
MPFDPRENPDGGMQAWLVVAGGFCCLFVSFGWINCIGVFQNYYEKNQLRDMSPSTIAWIPSLEAFMMFLFGPVVGKLYDNYGPRWILLTGSFFHVFGLMMTSISSKYYQFILAQGICSPFGASLIFYPAMSVCSTWFFKRRALAFGIMAAGSSLGGVIFPIMIEQLLPKVGFGWSMRIAAFLILGLLIIANLTVRSRVPPFPRPLVLMEFVAPLKETPYTLVVIGSFLFFLGMFLPINYLIVQAQQVGMSARLAGYLIAILNALSLFGRVLPGYLGDRFGRFNVIIILTFFTSIITFALWIPARANAPIIVFAALYGFGSGTFVSMIPAVIAQISPDMTKIGVRTGTCFVFISIAALVSNPIGGALVEARGGDFLGAQIFAGCVMFGGGVALVAARGVQVEWKLNVKI